MKIACSKTDEDALAGLIREAKNSIRHANENDIADFLLKNGVVQVTEKNAKSVCGKIMGLNDPISPLVVTLKYHNAYGTHSKIATCFNEECVEVISSKADSCNIYVTIKAKFLNKTHLNRVINYLNCICRDPICIIKIKKCRT